MESQYCNDREPCCQSIISHRPPVEKESTAHKMRATIDVEELEFGT